MCNKIYFLKQQTFQKNKLNVQTTIAEINRTLKRLRTPTTDASTAGAGKLKDSFTSEVILVEANLSVDAEIYFGYICPTGGERA